MLKVLNISHCADADGYGSAWLLDIAMGQQEVDHIFINYGDDLLEELENIKDNNYDLLYVTDLNFNHELMVEVKELLGVDNMVVVDHHPWQDIETGHYVKDGIQYHIDHSVSATKGLLNVIGPEELHEHVHGVVELINAADIFDKRDVSVFRSGRVISAEVTRLVAVINPDRKIELYNAIYSIVKNLFNFYLNPIYRLSPRIVDANISLALRSSFDLYFNRDDLTVLEYMSLLMAKIYEKYGDSYEYKGYKTIIVKDAKFSVSDLSSAMDADIKLFINTSKGTVAIRTTDRVSATEIARKHGGGGHFNASGCKIDDIDNIEEILIESIKEVIDEN